MQKNKIRESFNPVRNVCTRPPVFTPNQCTNDTDSIAITAITFVDTPLASVAYSPMAIATAEMAPAKPAIELIQPLRKPRAGWKILDKYKYSPPERFSVVAISA